MIIISCQQCGKEFKVFPYKIKPGKDNFCSYNCYWESKKGKKLSKEVCDKLSECKKGEKNHFFGKKHTKESKDLISKHLKGREVWSKGKKFPWLTKRNLENNHLHTGKNAYNWKGGNYLINEKGRKSVEYKLWRKSCLERDNFTCQKTGQIGGKLEVHHINNFSEFKELQTSIENGITLSYKSHKDFHKEYGFKNNTKEQLQKFLSK